ncbi:unnamed protein product [Mesocestoides corti]|uniref:Uncharacterized protein n=1 Tax=Mesocestoides corti TaxID=53468 RepID=A0A3P6I5I3_MESCO|nr:unnamed protein product [Mesocestoides corti]
MERIDKEAIQPSVVVFRCRICYEEESDPEPLMSPCRCRGTVGLLHKTCLERWLQVSQTLKCELCGYSYILRPKTPLPTPNTSKGSPTTVIGQTDFLRDWFRSRSARRNLATDCVFCVLLTLLTGIGMYFCITAMSHFTQANSFTWQVPTLIFLEISLMLILLVWIILAGRHHLMAYMSHRRREEDRIRESFSRRSLERRWRFSVHPGSTESSFSHQTLTPTSLWCCEGNGMTQLDQHCSPQPDIVVPTSSLYPLAETEENNDAETQPQYRFNVV